MAAPGPTEQVLASLHVEQAAGLEAVVRATVSACGPGLGLTDEQGEHLARAAAAVAGAIGRHGFDDPADAAVDLAVVRVGHRAVVRIDDEGLPYSAAAEDAEDRDVIAAAMAGGWLDGLQHANLGRAGNRTELVRHLDPGPDLRDADEPVPPGESDEPVPADHPVTIRLGVPADAEGICRLTWRTYGATYQHDEYYRPEQLAAMIDSGLQASFVAVDADGEVLGHSAVLLERPDDVVVEAGRAMVDPRFRGHHMMAASRDLRVAWMHDHGVLALVGAAVTAHTRSQTDRPVCSIQLGFLPPIQFRGIDGTGTARREAVVGGFIPVAPVPAQPVHLPAADAAILREIFDLNELDRPAAAGAAPPPTGATSQLGLDLRGDLGHAVVAVEAVGDDLGGALADRLATVARAGLAVTYADLRLDDPATPWAAEVLASAGFVFTGLLPLAAAGVDVVRYQHLGDLEVDPDEIHLRHPFARRLLDYVLAQRTEVHP